MPLTYPAGVMKEHLHTREHAGLFDISHMKLFDVSGPGAAALLDRACPLDAAALEISQSKYTFFLNDKAGIIDDLIVTRLGAGPLHGRRQCRQCRGRRGASAASWPRISTSRSTPLDRVFLAIQGPEAADVLLARRHRDRRR